MSLYYINITFFVYMFPIGLWEFQIILENNILITENGNIDLMEHIAIEAEEIEELMNR